MLALESGLEKLRNHIDDKQLFAAGAKLLLAVSGGSDSRGVFCCFIFQAAIAEAHYAALLSCKSSWVYGASKATVSGRSRGYRKGDPNVSRFRSPRLTRKTGLPFFKNGFRGFNPRGVLGLPVFFRGPPGGSGFSGWTRLGVPGF